MSILNGSIKRDRHCNYCNSNITLIHIYPKKIYPYSNVIFYPKMGRAVESLTFRRSSTPSLFSSSRSKRINSRPVRASSKHFPCSFITKFVNFSPFLDFVRYSFQLKNPWNQNNKVNVKKLFPGNSRTEDPDYEHLIMDHNLWFLKFVKRGTPP